MKPTTRCRSSWRIFAPATPSSPLSWSLATRGLWGPALPPRPPLISLIFWWRRSLLSAPQVRDSSRDRFSLPQRGFCPAGQEPKNGCDGPTIRACHPHHEPGPATSQWEAGAGRGEGKEKLNCCFQSNFLVCTIPLVLIHIFLFIFFLNLCTFLFWFLFVCFFCPVLLYFVLLWCILRNPHNTHVLAWVSFIHTVP